MKKFVTVISAIVAALMSTLTLVACSSGAPEHDISADPSDLVISSQTIEAKVEDFIEKHPDRTSFSQKERAAAEYINGLLVDYGYSGAALQEFSVIGNKSSDEKTSQNVIAVYPAAERNDDTKNIILGAIYDNTTSAIESKDNSTDGTGGDGALMNGTGVATLLAIAEYLKTENPSYDFDVTIAFFGASCLYDYGAETMYVKMSDADRARTVLAVELRRLGGEYLYAYSDARETGREEFFDRIAADNGLNVYKVTQKSPPFNTNNTLNGFPYYQWAHDGFFCQFFNRGIPTLNLVGANWEGLDLTNEEFVGSKPITYSADDTLNNLKSRNPDYAVNSATAATLLIKSMSDGAFIDTMTYDKANFPDTDIFTKSWVWLLVVLGIIAIAYVGMSLVTNYIGKKHPIVVRQPKKMKMAVFGMDYEDKDDDSIFVDMKNGPSALDEIFPGIPNNEPHDPVFPNYAPPPFAVFTETREVKGDDVRNGKTDPFGADEQKPPVEIHDFEIKPSDDKGGQAIDSDKESDAQTPPTDKKESDSAAAPSEKEKTHTTEPRKRVSAGKSTSAKKSTSAGGKKKDDNNETDK